MSKKVKCMADGGIIGSDGLTDRQRAALGAARNSLGVSNAPPPPAPVQAPVQAPAPAPMPQQQGITSGIVGILKGRQQQIDKASGYAAGGIVRGKGGVDRVPMAIGGVDVNLTGGKKPEAVLPGKTVEALGGPAAVESLIEATNGKPPVRDGLKAGGRYASGLVIEEDDPRLKPFGPTAPALGSGLYGTGRTVASTDVPPPATFTDGRDATGTITADSAQSMSAAPMTRPGGIAGSIDMAGVNGILARENKIRGEMNAMQSTGFATPSAPMQPGQLLPGEIAPGITQQNLKDAQWNDSVGTNRGETKALLEGIAAHRGNAANDTARYGHDVAAQRAAGHDQVLMRGQDISGANEAVRAGVDRERLGIAQADSRRADQRFGIEKGILEGNAADQKTVRDARAALIAAQASGDTKAIEAAKANAMAVGIKFDKPNNEYSFNANPMTGELTVGNKDTGAATVWQKGKKVVDIAAHGTQPARRTPTDEEIAATAKNRGMSVDAVRKLLGL